MASVKQRSLLRLWQDVIFALFVRHLVSKFNDKFGVSWLIIQPVAFIVIMSFIRGRLEGGLIHGLEPFVFMLVPGRANTFRDRSKEASLQNNLSWSITFVASGYY